MEYYKKHDIEAHVKEMSKILKTFMDEMVKKHACVGEARCIGLFAAFTIVKDKEKRMPLVPYHDQSGTMATIMAKHKSKGFSTFGREDNINICPPLIITKEELETYLPIMDEVLTWVDETYCVGK